MGINNLLTMKGLFGPKELIVMYPQIADISNMINVIAKHGIYFLPALIGWSSMRVFGGSPILGLSLRFDFNAPQLVSQYDLAKGNIPTWNLFGLEIKQLNYQGQVLPVLIAAYVLAKIEKGLNKVVHDSIKMLVVWTRSAFSYWIFSIYYHWTSCIIDWYRYYIWCYIYIPTCWLVRWRNLWFAICTACNYWLASYVFSSRFPING